MAVPIQFKFDISLSNAASSFKYKVVTCPQADGEALLCACLRHWLTTHSDACPHVFVSTHFHGALSHLPKSPLLSSQVDSYMTFLKTLVMVMVCVCFVFCVCVCCVFCVCVLCVCVLCVCVCVLCVCVCVCVFVCVCVVWCVCVCFVCVWGGGVCVCKEKFDTRVKQNTLFRIPPTDYGSDARRLRTRLPLPAYRWQHQLQLRMQDCCQRRSAGWHCKERHTGRCLLSTVMI